VGSTIDSGRSLGNSIVLLTGALAPPVFNISPIASMRHMSRQSVYRASFFLSPNFGMTTRSDKMNTNTHPQGAAPVASQTATTHAFTHEVTSADVEAALQRNAVQVANANGVPFSVMADEIFDDLDLSRIERAALAAGTASADQARATRDAIADQLVEQGILKRKVTVIERVNAAHRANIAAEVFSIPDLLPVLQEVRAWFNTSGPVATRLDTVIAAVRTQSGQQQNIRDILLRKALAGFGSVGDIYTNAPECSASVSAAENLGVLAHMLCTDDGDVCKGTLFADGAAVGEVSVRINGKLYWDAPASLNLSVESWSVALPGGEMVRVALFEGDTDTDATWVVDAPEAFYKALMGGGLSA
jgi:hypothetical protein